MLNFRLKIIMRSIMVLSKQCVAWHRFLARRQLKYKRDGFAQGKHKIEDWAFEHFLKDAKIGKVGI